MAMITCKECGKEFSDKADKCPNCGAPVEIPQAPKKMSKCLLISLIIGAAYLIYSLWYWFGGGTGISTDTAEQIGTGIATALVTPHLVCTALAVLFNAFGLFMKKRGFALTGAILYTVALVLFPMYFMFVIIEVILSFIGYAKTPKH